MCGIAGIWSNDKNDYLSLDKRIRLMTGVLKDRGPDDFKIWINKGNSLAFGHTRLSIQDLSQIGSQPMTSPSGRYTLIFNGEIYNHKNLRLLLNKSNHIEWKGTSDTETLAHLIDKYGFKETLKKIHGMFAIALWDNTKKKIQIARDRIGEKPLYYGFHKDNFYFFSDLRPLYQLQGQSYKIDNEAVNLFLTLGYIPSPMSIFKDFKKLPPGTFANITSIKDSNIEITRYWNLADSFSKKSDSINYDEFEDILTESVESQLISDRTVGGFLSGGIDSSLICSIMKKKLKIELNTFSISLNHKSFNEGEYARKVASIIGSKHHDYLLNYDEMAIIAKSMSKIYSEPFADSSQIPTLALSKFAKQRVTVSLSGDGGDELFAGYNRHKYLKLITRYKKIFPNSFFSLSQSILRSVDKDKVDMFFQILFRVIPKNLAFAYPSDKLMKVLSMTNSKTIRESYADVVSSSLHGNNKLLLEFLSRINRNQVEMSDIDELLFYDQSTYLPDDILTKVDRASMSTSLEVRAPFLSHKVIQYANSLETKIKIGRKTKLPLRNLLKKYLPENLINRPKMGFSIPLGQLLRKDLRFWANQLLSYDSLSKHNFFDNHQIKELWNDHLKDKQDNSRELWNILIFQDWFMENEKFIEL